VLASSSEAVSAVNIGTVEKSSMVSTGKGEKEYGTQLVSDLISSEKLNVIRENLDGNSTAPFDNEEGKSYLTSTGNGEGANTIIGFNPYETTGGVDVKGETTRPTFIGLGHEFIHARNMNRGQRNDTETNKKDPEVKNNSRVLKMEEINVRKEENKLRIENNITPRIIP
jgi:hypothetical protein